MIMELTSLILKRLLNFINKYFVDVGTNIDRKIPKPLKHFKYYMTKLKVNKTFFLTPATPAELFDILAFDIKKSLGPNSIPVYILKIANLFFSNKLCDIINLSFKTCIFPVVCKLAKVVPISLLSIYSKIFEKVIYKCMYDYLEKNKLFYSHQFGFRA